MGVRRSVRIAAAVTAVAAVVGVGAAVTANDSKRGFRESLSGYEEFPALSTDGFGTFRGTVNGSGTELSYRLTFGGMTTNVRFAHIHFENATNNGPVIVFLCSNEGPASAPACPPTGGTVTGTLDATDVGGGAAGQGIAAGEFDEFVDALRSGATYVNVHTVERGGGEIRAQID